MGCESQKIRGVKAGESMPGIRVRASREFRSRSISGL